MGCVGVHEQRPSTESDERKKTMAFQIWPKTPPPPQALSPCSCFKLHTILFTMLSGTSRTAALVSCLAIVSFLSRSAAFVFQRALSPGYRGVIAGKHKVLTQAPTAASRYVCAAAVLSWHLLRIPSACQRMSPPPYRSRVLPTMFVMVALL